MSTSRTTVLVGDLAYQFSRDATASRQTALWTVVTLRVVDEITSAEPESKVWAKVSEPGLLVQLGAGGQVGLVARPAPGFPRAFAPGFSVSVTVGAERFLSRTLTLPIARALTAGVASGATTVAVDDRTAMAAGQTWRLGDPAVFEELVTVTSLGPGPSELTLSAPLSAVHPAGATLRPGPLTELGFGDLLLHRMPVTIRGRVKRWVPAINAFEPAAAATIEVAFTWRQRVQVTSEAAKQATRMVSISPGLYDERRASIDLLQPVTQSIVVGDDKALADDAFAGDRAISLSNGAGIGAGALLRVDREDSDVRETISVASVSSLGGTDAPTLATMVHPLVLPHRRGVTVDHVSTSDVLTAKALSDDALPGDPVLFLSDLGFGGTVDGARIGGGALPEHQSVRSFATATDAEGYFALPPIARVAKARLVITPIATPAQNVDIEPDYRSSEQWLDVSFS